MSRNDRAMRRRLERLDRRRALRLQQDLLKVHHEVSVPEHKDQGWAHRRDAPRISQVRQELAAEEVED